MAMAMAAAVNSKIGFAFLVPGSGRRQVACDALSGVEVLLVKKNSVFSMLILT
jgi:hypothetical protein